MSSSLSPNGRLRSPNVFKFSSPINSPGRPQRLIQEGILHPDDPAFKSAMEKIYEASWKFDRAKSEDLLKTLDNRELLPEQFRQMLKAGMNCKFTNEEFEAIFPIFDNHGYVDGTEFIMIFYRNRYEHRSRLLKARADINRRRHEFEKALKEKQEEALENKRILTLVDDFTKEDEKSALEKLVNAAVKYDRLMPGAVPLDAFDIEKMNPGEFREQMKAVFNVQLTIKELSAFIAYFNRDRDPTDKSINCAAFLVSFFRIGFQEKSNRLREVWAEKKRFAEEKQRKLKEEQEELAKKNASKVNFVFTPEEKERAIVKLRTAAKLYDKTTPGAMSMKAFEVKEMAPHVFKEQLRRIFNLQVTPAEMGALMTVFDVNGDGVITCEEFTKVFLNMGFEEREKELKEAREKQKKYEETKKQEEINRQQAIDAKNALKVSFQYNEEEFNSAMQKLVEAAWRYDKTMPGAASLEAFEAQYMEAHILKDQLKKSFFLKLTPQELGAVMHYFDPEDTGRINCAQFLKKFFRVGYEERQRKKELWRVLQKELVAKRLEEEKQKLEALATKNSAVLSASAKHQAAALALAQGGGDALDNNSLGLSQLSSLPSVTGGQDFTEKDFQNAFFKLTLGAIKYDRALPNAMNLTAFECISMPPHIFREQLKLTFNIKVSVAELWALLSYFDKDHTGEINCKKFVNQFLRTGYEERNRIKEQWRMMKQLKEEKEQQKEIEKLKEKEALAYKECDFDFNEQEFNAIIYRFVLMCHTVDKRAIGPAGLTAFESESLNPAEFREMLKRTFNFKFQNNKELGALVSFFDIHGKKVVHCSTFINLFTQTRAYCEDFKGKPDEQQKLLQYVLGLKESYRHRVAKNPSVEARPWRQQNAISSFHGNKKIFKRKEPKPLNDPLEKYRLRLFIGKKTGRMDLTTKASWPVRSNSPPASQASMNGSRVSSPTLTKRKTVRSRSNSPAVLGKKIAEGSENNSQGEIAEPTGFGGEESEESFKNPAISMYTAEELGEGERTPISGIFAELAMASRSRSVSVKSLVIEEDSSPRGDDQSRASGSKDQAMPPVPTSLPVEEELEFRLSVIPPEIFKIADLRELWLDNHRISIIPPDINNLKNLQVLSIKNNQLEFLPPQLSDLIHLKKLYLNFNQLNALPNLLWKCISLEELFLSNNLFSEFPEVITAIPSLRMVDLSKNSLVDLPKSLHQMKSLQFLLLDKNRIEHAPLVLSRLPWVNVSGCPIPVDSKAAMSLTISPTEEYELLGLMKGRAAVKITSKLRRRKKKSSYIL